jgi:hypothetical protein
MFDVEANSAGSLLILAEGRFAGGPAPKGADLRLARWRGQDFALDPASDRLFAQINTKALEYAAALSADELTLIFTRVTPGKGAPRLWIATRPDLQAAFTAPKRIEAITGFVEAATFAPDGAIYFHRLENGRYGLWRSGAQ